jgi:hypothetical protein
MWVSFIGIKVVKMDCIVGVRHVRIKIANVGDLIMLIVIGSMRRNIRSSI